jgi:ELWxxDGT repeat protein
MRFGTASIFGSALVLLVLAIGAPAIGAVGTPVLVKDINPSGDSTPAFLTNVGGTLFFSATGPGGTELWKTDGRTAGTRRVKDINPSGGSNPAFLTKAGSRVFFAADDGTTGFELWKSHGTAAGTKRVKDIKPSGGSNPLFLTAVGRTLFFSADDGTTGFELWKSNGTGAGTKLVEDIRPQGGVVWASFPGHLANVGGTLFFRADEGTTGFEPWRSDGTRIGTERIADLNQGSEPSNPEDFLKVGRMAFFTGNEGIHGRELWKVRLYAGA